MPASCSLTFYLCFIRARTQAEATGAVLCWIDSAEHSLWSPAASGAPWLLSIRGSSRVGNNRQLPVFASL